MTDNERPSSANPYAAEMPDSAYYLVVDPTKPAKSQQDVKLTWALQKILLADFFAIGPSLTPFSAVRTSNTTINGDEFRLPYNCAAGNITPTMPTASNGRALWFYNDGTVNNIIINNVEGSITEIITPGNRIALVGNGTNWRYQ